jgi:hypothetical protein
MMELAESILQKKQNQFCKKIAAKRQWLELGTKLQEVCLENGPDKVSWNLEPSGKLSTKSVYQALCKGPTVQITDYL